MVSSRRFHFSGGILLAVPLLNTSFTTHYQRRIQKDLHGSKLSLKHKNKSRLFSIENERDGKPSVSITGISSSRQTTTHRPFSFSSAIDFILSFLISDIGSISLGLIGLIICMYNRLSSIDLDSTSLESANAMGIQSRTDLLAVIASGSVLLNGVSKLDVTSALASSVDLEGKRLETPILVENNPWMDTKHLNSQSFRKIAWAMDSFLGLVQTAILVGHDGKQWHLLALSGIIPNKSMAILPSSTPILDKFLKSSKETYLPTLQSLPGKAEFTYLPPNSQEVLLLPVLLPNDESYNEQMTIVVALASDTAKSLTPRDIAWCQVAANRLGIDFKSIMDL